MIDVECGKVVMIYAIFNVALLMVKLPLRRSRELGPYSCHGESRSSNYHFTCCIAVQVVRAHSDFDYLLGSLEMTDEIY
jgi:hypothetical protein